MVLDRFFSNKNNIWRIFVLLFMVFRELIRFREFFVVLLGCLCRRCRVLYFLQCLGDFFIEFLFFRFLFCIFLFFRFLFCMFVLLFDLKLFCSVIIFEFIEFRLFVFFSFWREWLFCGFRLGVGVVLSLIVCLGGFEVQVSQRCRFVSWQCRIKFFMFI